MMDPRRERADLGGAPDAPLSPTSTDMVGCGDQTPRGRLVWWAGTPESRLPAKSGAAARGNLRRRRLSSLGWSSARDGAPVAPVGQGVGRGRGISGDLAYSPSTKQEVSDLRAVMDATGAGRVFGVSSGAVVAARAALADTRITRLALFEPPISVDGSIRLDLIAAVQTALEHDQLPRAMGLAMKAAEMGPPWMFSLLEPVLALASRLMLHSPENRRLAYAVRADFTVVAENAGHVADFAALTSPTVLLAGRLRGPTYTRQSRP